MEPNYAPATGMDRIALFIVPQEMIIQDITVAMDRRERWFVTQIGMGRTAQHTVCLRTAIGTVIIIVTKSMAANSVIAIGLEPSALSSVYHAMIHMGTTTAIKSTAVRFAWRTGSELNAERIAKLRTTHEDTTAVMLRMEPRYVTRIGLDQTVQYTVHREMIRRGIMNVILAMETRYATGVGLAPVVQRIVCRTMTPRGIMIVGRPMVVRFVIQRGMAVTAQ